jgi:hypothetical protein
MTGASTTNRRSICAGCNTRINSKALTRSCIFARSGFSVGTFQARPCCVVYHRECICVGSPCRTRLNNHGGLSFPLKLYFPNYTCESCTVRAHLGRELVGSEDDRDLLKLERVRMVDVGNAWAQTTMGTYQTYINRMLRFETRFDLSILTPEPLKAPVCSPSIVLAWCQEHYACQKPSGNHPNSDAFVSFATVRKLRSAAANFYEWDLQLSHPDSAIREFGSRRPLISNGCRPTDTLQYALVSAGMGKRLGEANKPPQVLLHEHVEGIIRMRAQNWSDDLSPTARYMVAAPIIVDLSGWLGWLRGGEIFGLDREDLEVITPAEGPLSGLPVGVGAVLLRLNPVTKSSPTRQADLAIAFKTWSKMEYGLWIQRLLTAMDDLNWTSGALFRQVTTNKRWDSRFFRTTFLYPALRWLRDCGMLSLQRYVDDSEHMQLEMWFYSMGCYRRGGRSDVSKKRPHNLRAATRDEVHEHGRWKYAGRVDPNMLNHYRQWELCDRVTLTRLCT